MANPNPDTKGLEPGRYKFTKEDIEKSVAVRQEKAKKRKTIREAFDVLLQMDFKTEDGEVLSGVEAITLKQMKNALDGNTESFKTIRDSVGEKPVEKVILSEVDPDVIREVEQAVLDDGQDTGGNVPAE